MRYNTFDNKSTNTNTRTKLSNNCNTHNQPLNNKKKGRESINYYSTPVVSAPLITAFGLPTLIECEESPSKTSTTTSTKDGAPSHSPKFTPLNRSFSLPVSPSSDTTIKTKEQQYQRLRSKSYFESNNTNALYTYRARSTNSKNKLTITMSKEAAYFNELSFHDDENDVSDSDTGLLMTSLPDPPPSDDDKAAAQSPLDTNGINGHQNGKIPTEMLDPTQTKTTPTLKLWPLAVLVFYNVSGGPFGIEPSIRAGGNFFAIIGFIIFPLIWSVPEALVTAELGSAFQDPAAGVAWVEEAFGESAASVTGYLAWVSGATDNAIYPTLFMEYVTSVLGYEDFSGLTRFISIAIITVCLAILNYSGLEIVGNASIIVCILAMSPFVILTIVGIPKVVPSRWLQMPEEPDDALFDDDFQTSSGPLPLLTLGGILWRPYLNNLFWNLNSFDSAGCFAGETSDVHTTYPRGIFIGLIMSVLSYVIPVLIAVGATDYEQADWEDGHLGTVAVDIGGKWLGMWTIFAAAISNLALFEAEMSSDAFQLMGMAERGILPKIFSTRSKHGTPTAGICFNTMVIIAFSCADFGQLLELLNSVYAISLLLEYAAFVKLRLYNKEMHRPYRIPVPDWAAPLVVLPPTLGVLLIFLLSNWFVYIFCAGALLFGFVVFKLSELCKRRGWLEFETKQSNFKYDVAPVGSPRLTNGDTEYHDNDEAELPENSSGSSEEDDEEDDETETPPSNENNEIETRTPMKIV